MDPCDNQLSVNDMHHVENGNDASDDDADDMNELHVESKSAEIRRRLACGRFGGDLGGSRRWPLAWLLSERWKACMAA